MYTCQSRSARPPDGLLGRKSVGLTRTSAGYRARQQKEENQGAEEEEEE